MFPSTPAGASIQFHLWIPSGTPITAVQPFVLQSAAGNWAWTGNWQPASGLTANAWNTIILNVPVDASPLYELGVQFTLGAAWSGTVYLDAISW